jgi:hypothetical protein
METINNNNNVNNHEEFNILGQTKEEWNFWLEETFCFLELYSYLLNSGQLTLNVDDYLPNNIQEFTLRVSYSVYFRSALNKYQNNCIDWYVDAKKTIEFRRDYLENVIPKDKWDCRHYNAINNLFTLMKKNPPIFQKDKLFMPILDNQYFNSLTKFINITNETNVDDIMQLNVNNGLIEDGIDKIMEGEVGMKKDNWSQILKNNMEKDEIFIILKLTEKVKLKPNFNSKIDEIDKIGNSVETKKRSSLLFTKHTIPIFQISLETLGLMLSVDMVDKKSIRRFNDYFNELRKYLITTCIAYVELNSNPKLAEKFNSKSEINTKQGNKIDDKNDLVVDSNTIRDIMFKCWRSERRQKRQNQSYNINDIIGKVPKKWEKMAIEAYEKISYHIDSVFEKCPGLWKDHLIFGLYCSIWFIWTFLSCMIILNINEIDEKKLELHRDFSFTLIGDLSESTYKKMKKKTNTKYDNLIDLLFNYSKEYYDISPVNLEDLRYKYYPKFEWIGNMNVLMKKIFYAQISAKQEKIIDIDRREMMTIVNLKRINKWFSSIIIRIIWISYCFHDKNISYIQGINEFMDLMEFELKKKEQKKSFTFNYLISLVNEKYESEKENFQTCIEIWSELDLIHRKIRYYLPEGCDVPDSFWAFKSGNWFTHARFSLLSKPVCEKKEEKSVSLLLRDDIDMNCEKIASKLPIYIDFKNLKNEDFDSLLQMLKVINNADLSDLENFLIFWTKLSPRGYYTFPFYQIGEEISRRLILLSRKIPKELDKNLDSFLSNLKDFSE